MPPLFAIVLAENRQVFQPGETISGALLLNTDKEINLRGVRVELHGLGHVRIRSGKVTYERKETYLSFQSILLGRGPFQGGSDVNLQPGNYNFPFQFPLPPHSLPTSFEGDYGSVRYWLNAVADRPWRSNFQTHSPLFIVERVQINDPAFLEPSMQRKDRMLGWPCCPSGQLYANARIDRLAYCPGQEVKISGNISNESGKQVLGSEVQLVQRVIFKAPQGTTRTCTEKVYVVKNERGVAPGEETSVEFDSFVIPSVQPTTKGFSCIEISYEIRFIVRVAKAFNTDITFPVVITTVPPSAQPSIDPVLSHQIYRALANYLASRIAAELANDKAVEETEVGGQTVSDGSGALANGPPDVEVQRGERPGTDTGRQYQYSRMV